MATGGDPTGGGGDDATPPGVLFWGCPPRKEPQGGDEPRVANHLSSRDTKSAENSGHYHYSCPIHSISPFKPCEIDRPALWGNPDIHAQNHKVGTFDGITHRHCPNFCRCRLMPPSGLVSCGAAGANGTCLVACFLFSFLCAGRYQGGMRCARRWTSGS